MAGKHDWCPPSWRPCGLYRTEAVLLQAFRTSSCPSASRRSPAACSLIWLFRHVCNLLPVAPIHIFNLVPKGKRCCFFVAKVLCRELSKHVCCCITRCAGDQLFHFRTKPLGWRLTPLPRRPEEGDLSCLPAFPHHRTERCSSSGTFRSSSPNAAQASRQDRTAAQGERHRPSSLVLPLLHWPCTPSFLQRRL